VNERDTKPKFAEFEIIRFLGIGAGKQAISGQIGVVLAVTEKDDGGWYYTAYIMSDACCWCFEEAEIISTGRFADPKEFERSSSVRVRVDHLGQGWIVE
jgi:hypothetical protein